MKLAKDDVETGVMVALFPSMAVQYALAQPGGEPPNDLHVTLAFLGDASEVGDIDRLVQVIGGFAATAPSVTGEVSGTGTFTAGPEPVTYASVDCPCLPHVRDRLVEMLCCAGFPADTTHGYMPHLTLAYADLDIDVPNLPLEFDTMTLAVAGQRYDFPFTGTDDLHKADTAGSISTGAWDGSSSRFTDEQWRRSCILDRGPSYTTAKSRYALPVREPDGAINRRALAAAAGRLGSVNAHPEQIAAARTELRRLYTQAGLTAPGSIDAAKREWVVPLWKSTDAAQRIVYGVVLQPGVRDSQGDVVSAAEIEQAAHRYLVESRKQDLQHDEQQVPVEVVESYIAPADMEVAGRPVLKGSWVMASHVPDDSIWAAICKDEITGYSIGGTAVRAG